MAAAPGTVFPPEGSPLAVTAEMETMMKKMNYPIARVRRLPSSSVGLRI